MKITFEFFGQLTDITKIKTFEANDATDTDMALKKLYENFPGLADSKFIIAVNNSLIQKNTVLTGDCSIALMPPYSGG